MSREVSRERTRSRTRSPDFFSQKILNLDSSPGSSRRIGEHGTEDSVNIPNFSKEVSLDSDEDPINEAVNRYLENQCNEVTEQCLNAPAMSTSETPKNISPKSILKKRDHEQPVTKKSEIKENLKCCHPIVDKIKYIADKTLHKYDKSDKSPNAKRKKENEELQIVQLKTSPGAVRRHNFGTIKLGDSDEMSRTLTPDTSPRTKKKKEHIYEDIERTENEDAGKIIHFSPEILESLSMPLKCTDDNIEDVSEKKSNNSQDPSLVNEDEEELKPDEHVMECLYKHSDFENEALILDADSEEPDIEEVIQNQLEEEFGPQNSPNITITEITEESNSSCHTPIPDQEKRITVQVFENDNSVETKTNPDWSKSHSDHEYEIIGKPPPNIVYTSPPTEKPQLKADDEFSSTNSLERKYLTTASDEEESNIEKISNDNIKAKSEAQTLQKEIEDRYFVSTPSTISRTECDISTSQVDSSALENLPLKRDSRGTNEDSKLQQRFKEQREKIRNQAGKLKTKLQSIKSRQFSLPERSKFKLPQMPDRPKLTILDRRKFSLPERPKFKKINLSEKLSIGDRKKFTFPDRPKFNMPEMPKFKIPDKAKLNFSSLGRKPLYQTKEESVGSSENIKNIVTVDFESKTYPRLFHRKKKRDPLATSSPVLNRVDTPPPSFSFAKVSKANTTKSHYDSNSIDDAQGPREYGSLPRSTSYDTDNNHHFTSYDNEYDFDKIESEYDEENRIFHEAVKGITSKDEQRISLPDVSSSQPEYTHVINEINNDEFFVRPKGISRENIEVRQYLSDEIREAFKMPTNSLALMGGQTVDPNKGDFDGEEADPELYLEVESDANIAEEYIDKDDGYYTFPPVRPSRAKKNKKVIETVEYIDNSVNASMQFSDVDIEGDHELELQQAHIVNQMPHESKTLPLPPKRKKKSLKSDLSLSSLHDLQLPTASYPTLWNDQDDTEDIIVYRTEHKYVVPEPSNTHTEHSPLPPRRMNRSRSSHATSVADDDRTSQGAESLTLDPNVSTPDPDCEFYKKDHAESPGYATVEKYPPTKMRRSKSKTPPTPRRRKSHSSERKYYTVDRITKDDTPDRPPRKRSSTSLMTLESLKKNASTGDITQYVEIDEIEKEQLHKNLNSGHIVNKMRDRPLPPPPRPPRGSKKIKMENEDAPESNVLNCYTRDENIECFKDNQATEEIVEIEVSTQTDPLPDDIDYELGIEENIDVSMSSSLRDFRDDDLILRRSQSRLVESPKLSRPSSRSDKSLIPGDPKVQELSRNNLGRTSPTVILVERRVSSPTRINEREEIVTEASLTVQPIDIDEDKVPEVPPLPQANAMRPPRCKDLTKGPSNEGEGQALEKIGGVTPVIADVQLDNLVTQKLQVRDLDVGRLNVSELQASKILVSEIEGITLQVNELDSKSGHISVSGIELSPSVIDEIVKKFSELATGATLTRSSLDIQKPISREEQTQTDEQTLKPVSICSNKNKVENGDSITASETTPSVITTSAETATPPVRPPPPDLSPLVLSYMQELPFPPATFYNLRAPRDRPFSEYYEAQGSVAAPPPPPTRRVKRRTLQHSGSSSEEDLRKLSPRRVPPSHRVHEPSITEAGAQFFRVCHHSVTSTLRNMFNSLMSYVSRNEDKKDVQMAIVIFLVLIAGLIMFGLSDGRTVHHHHWEFFNPPDANHK